MRSTKVVLGLASLAMLAVPSAARADLTFIGPVGATGGGLGNQFTVLTLQSPGNTSLESGCVTPTGIGSMASCGFANVGVQTGAAQTGVQLLSQTGLAGLTGSTLRVIYNGAEPGSDPGNTLTGLSLTLYSGNTGVFTATLPAGFLPRDFETFQGTGNLGYLFGLTPAQAAQFDAARAAATGTLSIGAGASVANAQGGQETFAIAVGPTTPGGGTGTVVPEPSTYMLMGTGLLGLAGFAKRRRRA